MDSEEKKTIGKRTTITIDPDVKLVFDYAQTQYPAKNASEQLQNLLMAKFAENDWNLLYRKAAEYFRRCRIHDKPHILMCKTCEIAFCEDCDLTEHEGHDVQFYCTKHQMAYKRQCYLCEKEAWEKKVKIQAITQDELAHEIKTNPDLILIDVRGRENKPIIQNSIRIPYHHFREQTEENKKLQKLAKKHPDSKWVTYSEGRPGYLDSMRGWLAALDLKVKYKIQNVLYLEGGFSNFSVKHPEFSVHPTGERT